MATRYDCRTAGFMDDVMFSHNGANRPESKMARMFCPVRLVAAPVGRQITFARLAALGAKSAVSECILLQVFFFAFHLYVKVNAMLTLLKSQYQEKKLILKALHCSYQLFNHSLAICHMRFCRTRTSFSN